LRCACRGIFAAALKRLASAANALAPAANALAPAANALAPAVNALAAAANALAAALKRQQARSINPVPASHKKTAPFKNQKGAVRKSNLWL